MIRCKKKIFNMLPKGGVGAYIGVWKGNDIGKILEINQPEKLCLVDPWKLDHAQPHRRYGSKAVKGQYELDAIHDEIVSKWASNPSIQIFRMTSWDFLRIAASWSTENRLDWVYLDGDHRYKEVGEDLYLSDKAVKHSGWITGDDYWWHGEMGGEYRYPVRQAVIDFLGKGNARYYERIRTQFAIQKEGSSPNRRNQKVF